MFLLFSSFAAGVLTILAPCVLPLLPIIIGGSAATHTRKRPLVIAASLSISIVLFTLLLKFGTLFIAVPESFWKIFSASIIGVLGLSMVFPNVWTRWSTKLGLGAKTERTLERAGEQKGFGRDIAIGAALGPVFSSCSPTYFFILASVLPVSFAKGLAYLLAYAFGLSLMLFLIGVLGQKLVKKVMPLANPNGTFRRGLGVIFLVVALAIGLGIDKKISTGILDRGFFDVTKLEQYLLPGKDEAMVPEAMACADGVCTTTPGIVGGIQFARYQEIANPAGFLHTEPFTLGEHIGKKIILLDFMTYSCINCVRTFPYLKAWDEAYRDKGLLIVGIHTPEFAFEKDADNVAAALKKHGLTFPIVLDNSYGTWNAYKNSYWPRKYLIDLAGNIVYDHIGEGNYDETEAMIRKLLSIDGVSVPSPVESVSLFERQSAEVYFGYDRLKNFGSGVIMRDKEQVYTTAKTSEKDTVYLEGKWVIGKEYVEAVDAGARMTFRYAGKNVYMVAAPGTNTPARVRVSQSGTAEAKELGIAKDDLYQVISNDIDRSGVLQVEALTPGVRLYTLTFGS